MTTLPTCKRMRHLRKKNRILLDKLESHSSMIKSELKTLKRSMRDKRPFKKGSPKDENKCKAWTKRNSSLQVLQALNVSDHEVANCVCSSHRRNQTSATSDDEREENGWKTNGISSMVGMSLPVFRSSDKQAESITANKNSHFKQEILSSIDYSPKSTFLRKMKSSYLGQCSCKDSGARKRTLPALAIHSMASAESSASTAYRGESECSVDDVTVRKESVWSERVSNFERLKKFRNSNWLDCHADNSECCNNEQTELKGKLVCSSFSPDLRKRNGRYKINDQLFAVPVDSNCDNFVYCSSCLDRTTQKLCGASPNQRILSIPGSLLEMSNSFASRKNGKFTNKESNMVSSELAKKLFRKPKPLNSMALRYQNGIN